MLYTITLTLIFIITYALLPKACKGYSHMVANIPLTGLSQDALLVVALMLSHQIAVRNKLLELANNNVETTQSI